MERHTPVSAQSTGVDFSDRLEFQLAHRGTQRMVKQSNYGLEQMFFLENQAQPLSVESLAMWPLEQQQQTSLRTRSTCGTPSGASGSRSPVLLLRTSGAAGVCRADATYPLPSGPRVSVTAPVMSFGARAGRVYVLCAML